MKKAMIAIDRSYGSMVRLRPSVYRKLVAALKDIIIAWDEVDTENEINPDHPLEHGRRLLTALGARGFRKKKNG